MTTPKKIVLIRESILQSWLRDASTFALFAGLIGLGWFLDSSAMQWAGFFVAVVALIGSGIGEEAGVHRTDIAGARKLVDEWEASQ